MNSTLMFYLAFIYFYIKNRLQGTAWDWLNRSTTTPYFQWWRDNNALYFWPNMPGEPSHLNHHWKKLLFILTKKNKIILDVGWLGILVMLYASFVGILFIWCLGSSFCSQVFSVLVCNFWESYISSTHPYFSSFGGFFDLYCYFFVIHKYIYLCH
jgi:hypothetical protein